MGGGETAGCCLWLFIYLAFQEKKIKRKEKSEECEASSEQQEVGVKDLLLFVCLL